MKILRLRIINCFGECRVGRACKFYPPRRKFVSKSDHPAATSSDALSTRSNCGIAWLCQPANAAEKLSRSSNNNSSVRGKSCRSGTFRRLIAQFNERLQSHLRIAQVRDQSSDLAHATILPRVAIFADLGRSQAASPHATFSGACALRAQ